MPGSGQRLIGLNPPPLDVSCQDRVQRAGGLLPEASRIKPGFGPQRQQLIPVPPDYFVGAGGFFAFPTAPFGGGGKAASTTLLTKAMVSPDPS